MRQRLQPLINIITNTETCHHWLNWWNSRKEFIFCAFTSKEALSSVGLVEAWLFDTRDSLFFEFQIEGLATGSFPDGEGLCQGKGSSTREDKVILLAEDIGRDLLHFGNRITSLEVKKKLFVKAN